MQNTDIALLGHCDVIIKFKPEARVICFASGEKSLETTIESIHFKFQDATTDNDLENPKILKIGVLPKKTVSRAKYGIICVVGRL